MQQIRIDKLEVGSVLIVESRSHIYTLEVVDPKECKVMVVGGTLCTEPMEVTMGKNTLRIGRPMSFSYKKKRQRKDRVYSSDAVMSIKILAANSEWNYTLENS